jgi:hypothetical protein
MIIEKVVYELPSDTMHKFEIVEVGELKPYNTQRGVVQKFTIKILVSDQKDKDGKDIYVFITATPSIGPKATFGRFMRRLKLDVSSRIDSDELIGLKFEGTIVYNEGEGAHAGTTFANVVLDTVKPLVHKSVAVEQV